MTTTPSACLVCAFATKHGHWPMKGTHCRDCHRSWTSHAQAHCVRCHEQFASNGTAERHWGRGGEHRDPVVAGLVAHDEAYGTVWRRPGDAGWQPKGGTSAGEGISAPQTAGVDPGTRDLVCGPPPAMAADEMGPPPFGPEELAHVVQQSGPAAWRTGGRTLSSPAPAPATVAINHLQRKAQP